GYGGLVARTRLPGRTTPGSKPGSSEDTPSMWACCTLNQTPNALLLAWCRCLESELPVQMSSDRSSKLRSLSQNILRAAPKWDVNITRLNLYSIAIIFSLELFLHFSELPNPPFSTNIEKRLDVVIIFT
ncbi:hypothetical protein AVEN_256380-1, partial [Araneus ventricosus]